MYVCNYVCIYIYIYTYTTMWICKNGFPKEIPMLDSSNRKWPLGSMLCGKPLGQAATVALGR